MASVDHRVGTGDLPVLDSWALPEIFLTGVRKTDEQEYLATARTPKAHAYFTDHRTGTIDPLFLLECCRQAGPYGGREFIGIDPDSKFLLHSCSFRLPGLASPAAAPGELPAEIALAVDAGGRPHSRAGARKVSYAFGLTLPGGRLGTARIDVRHVSNELYDTLRGRRDPAAARPAAPAVPVAPHLVGRTRASNVVLADVVADAGRGEARAALRLPSDNSSLFDRSYDHVPAMVLIEAARQLCLAASARISGAAAKRTTLVAADFSFHRFVELDAPVAVRLTAETRADGHGMTAALPELRSYQVEFEQGGEVAAAGRTWTTSVRTAAPAAGREMP
ncbi:AfsA-related hotdog domain-containing protein [Streptomyces mauvecolor]|uniref:AfsA-related hotdog domain-containing protein n=1 Tax=Streptomyces mauvecolor TaxID=58345 RepID=A0ABV9UI29_9ACTN